MKTIKQFLNEVKEIKKDGAVRTCIAYNKLNEVSIYKVSDYENIDPSFHISKLIMSENALKAENLENVKNALLTFEDVAKVTTLNKSRIDAYYKNGKRALIVTSV